MKTAVIAITERGARLAEKLVADLPGDVYLKSGLGAASEARRTFSAGIMTLAPRLFKEYQGLVFVMAVGIATRAVGSLVTDKRTDPAVVVVDDGGRYAVSLLCGHEGGANELALQVGVILGAMPVVTTASEIGRDVVVGVGCRRDVKAESVLAAVVKALDQGGVDKDSISFLCTVDVKRECAALRQAARRLARPLVFVPLGRIVGCDKAFGGSEAARKHLGVDGICEPAALIGAQAGHLLVAKTVLDGVTVALARSQAGEAG